MRKWFKKQWFRIKQYLFHRWMSEFTKWHYVHITFPVHGKDFTFTTWLKCLSYDSKESYVKVNDLTSLEENTAPLPYIESKPITDDEWEGKTK